MKLNDIRKVAIRGQLRIRFDLSNGMECVITEHGLSKVPGLDGVPDFNLENEFARALSFRLESVPPASAKDRGRVQRREIGREELEKMIGARGAAPEKDEE